MTKTYCVICDRELEGQKCPTCADRRGIAKAIDKLPKAIPVAKIHCITCDAENVLGDAKCKECGFSLPRNCGT